MAKIIAPNKNQQDFIDKIAVNDPQVFAFWDELDDKQKSALLDNIRSIDYEQTRAFYDKYVLHADLNKQNVDFDSTEYFSYNNRSNNFDMITVGENALSNGEVAFLTVAGGQASRLDYEAPKGCYPISPVKRKSLFQIFAEKIKFYNRRYDQNFYWYIMTSDTNYDDTVKFFNDNNFWSLDKSRVIFFKQGMLATITTDGKLILADKNKIFRNPDGHGGILTALLKTGALRQIADNKIKYISYFQVDNPLINMADPFFIGYHITRGFDVTTKVIKKLYPEEKIGVIGKKNGKNGVIEYSDLPKQMAYENLPNGHLKYEMGSIGIHIFTVDFLLNFTDKLPIHVAKKKVHGYANVDNDNQLSELDAYKFETFVFDMIGLADDNKSGFFETSRQQEFFPLKNKSGLDSIATCTKGQIYAYISWLVSAGIVPDTSVYKINKVEISPLFAADKENFIRQVALHKSYVTNCVYQHNILKDTIYIAEAKE